MPTNDLRYPKFGDVLEVARTAHPILENGFTIVDILLFRKVDDRQIYSLQSLDDDRCSRRLSR